LTFAPKKGKIIKVFSLLGRRRKIAAKFPSKRERARERRERRKTFRVGVDERVGDLLII
jgi:hypothetical protein